jgi:2-polyprenyl-3-methyl-5-hydroxy-6-metoxy-1,4-benzoquinol methylase
LIEGRTHPIDALVAEHGHIPQELLRERACPACEANEPKPELDKDHMSIVRCAACGFVYTNPIFDEDHYQEIYASPEYQTIVESLGFESHEYRRVRFGDERVRIMREHLRTPADATVRYADVGCSTGFVVEAAAAAGWRATGIDLNPSAIEFGRSRGLDLRVGDLGAIRDDAPFDAISLFDVLEHLTEPRSVVREVRELLAPDGIVFVYVPNYDSASRLLLGSEAHFIWPTHHLNYFTPHSAADFMQRLGFETELVVTEGLDLEDYLWTRERDGANTEELRRIAGELQFFINAGAYGKNLRVLARTT